MLRVFPAKKKEVLYMKKKISLLMACVLMLSLCACTVDPSGGQNAPALVTTTPNEQNSVSTTPDDELPATETPTIAEETVFKVGDTVELNDVTVKFIGVSEKKGSQYNKPEDGNIYVLCEFEIVNNSKKELAVSSMLNFEAYCDDYACDYSLGALIEKGNKEQLDGSVPAGKKMKGVVGYEVTKEWKELEVHYTLDFWTDSKIIFIATND